jgi:hypothetical protein
MRTVSRSWTQSPLTSAKRSACTSWRDSTEDTATLLRDRPDDAGGISAPNLFRRFFGPTPEPRRVSTPLNPGWPGSPIADLVVNCFLGVHGARSGMGDGPAGAGAVRR